MNEPQQMSAKLIAFVDFKSGNWRRVAVSCIEDPSETLETALSSLELMKRAFYARNHLLSPEEINELEKLYSRVKKAHPELGLA